MNKSSIGFIRLRSAGLFFQVVARGHFASVWQGMFQGSLVAVKVFPTALQKEFAKEKEVYKLPLMRNSGIVRFLGDGKLGKEFVLVLELATQVSLDRQHDD